MTTKRKVLVADASKVVRASLAKQLAEHFEIREEASGESAWQTLVLDNSIIGVVSGVALTRLDGMGLLERVRASKLARLKSLPFFLVVSNSFGEADRARARDCGATDFVSKDSSNTSMDNVVSVLCSHEHEILQDLDEETDEPAVSKKGSVAPEGNEIGVRTDVGVTDVLGRLGGVLGLKNVDIEGHEDPDESLGTENPVCAQEKLNECLSRYLSDGHDGRGLGILVFGIDEYQTLVVRHGIDLIERTVQKFTFMVARKIRPEDVICELPGGRVVIVAPAMTAEICTAFASRICKAMATAQIAVRGQRIDLTVSAGVAVVPGDGVQLVGQELLNLAYDRLEEAQRDGGNQIVATTNFAGSGVGNCEVFVPQLKELLASIDPAQLRPCLGTVGLQLMPVLKEIERTLRLGLPIEEINKRLWDRARTERLA